MSPFFVKKKSTELLQINKSSSDGMGVTQVKIFCFDGSTNWYTGPRIFRCHQ